ncbi:MAG: hypothetical protein R2854_14255 [Caldilineaceae bacterium]
MNRSAPNAWRATGPGYADARPKPMRAMRFLRAWELARAGADALRNRFGAAEVVVFGSLTDESRFHTHSDIDLAARGIREEDYLGALAHSSTSAPSSCSTWC